jgi:hypothetical protein
VFKKDFVVFCLGFAVLAFSFDELHFLQKSVQKRKVKARKNILGFTVFFV